MLVNPTGKAHKFRGVDWIVELLNLLTKAIYGGEGSNYTKARILLESPLVLVFRSSHANFERNFHLSGLTSKHADKDMTKTYEDVLKYMRTVKPNEELPNRASKYNIPDILMKGILMLMEEAHKAAAAGVQIDDEDDEAIGDVTAEDLGAEDEW